MTYNVSLRRKDGKMASNPVTSIRIHPDIMERASEVFDELGLTLGCGQRVPKGGRPRGRDAFRHEKRQAASNG